jgi:CubicO group peptidase (beta-lactamase class C family)
MKLNWLLVTSFLFSGVLHARELPYANSVSNGFRRDARVEIIEKSGNHTALIKSTEEQSPKVLRELEQTFQESESRVLIVSVDGKIIFEKYSSPFLAKWWTPLGFSMSKSVTALAVGQALCEGHISSLEDRIEAYVPELKGTSWGVASVEDVLKMSSGAYTTNIRYNGHKTAFIEKDIGGSVLSGKMSRNFIEYMKSVDDKTFTPGKYFNYNNFDTVALGLLVNESTKQSLPKYVERTIWKEVRAEHNGAWVVNNHGQASAYQGFSAHPHDWIRLGQWILRVLSDGETCFSNYLRKMTSNQIRSFGHSQEYGYQTWVGGTPGVDFSFVGFAGQYLTFNVKKRAVMYHHAAGADFRYREAFFDFGYIADRLLPE